MNKILCMYHENCADGFGAAWAVHRLIGDENVDFMPVNYNMACPVTQVYGRDVLIVDFSFSTQTLLALSTHARSLMIFDHHSTAKRELSNFPVLSLDYLDWLENVTPSNNCAAVFDMERSGAGLTWDLLSNDTIRPKIINLIEDRDLWKFKYGIMSKHFHAWLASFEYEAGEKQNNRYIGFDHLDTFNNSSLGKISFSINALKTGEAIYRTQIKITKELVRGNTRIMRIGCNDVPCANIPGHFTSEAGNIMCQGKPFSATYYDDKDKRIFSLRSSPEGADVGLIAKTYGGGGHTHAAGFTMPIGWEGE